MKIFRHIKLYWRMLILKKPYDFPFIGEEEGTPIGPELQVEHPAVFDAKQRACCCRLTKEVILNGVAANAMVFKKTNRISYMIGITTFQPCKI